MKKLCSQSALTLIELLVVIAIFAILAAMLLPALSRSGPSYNARCMNNQKQIDIAYVMWAADHEGEFPPQVSVTTNGSMEFISSGYACLQFRTLSEYLRSPDVFVCRLDKVKHAAENIKNLRDENVSYFINVDATTNNPSYSILTGDRNLQANSQPVKPGLFFLNPDTDISWTHEIHSRGGILSFADGHVQFVKTNDLNSVVRNHPSANESALCSVSFLFFCMCLSGLVKINF